MTRLLVTVVLVLVAGACGVRTDDSAVLEDPEDVPFGLLDDERVPVAAPERARGTGVELFFYDEDEERLATVRRQIEQPSLSDVLEELLDESPTSSNLRSAIADANATLDAEVSGGVAVIDISEELTDLSGSDQLIAIAQLVFTSTGRPGVGQVSFTLDGDPVEIPQGDGSLTSGTVTRGDYAGLRPA